jgi:hypothetical protein
MLMQNEAADAAVEPTRSDRERRTDQNPPVVFLNPSLADGAVRSLV